MSEINRYILSELDRTLTTLVEHNIIMQSQIDVLTQQAKKEKKPLDKLKMALLRGAILDPDLGFISFAVSCNMPYFLYPVFDDFFSKVFSNRYNLGMWPRSCMKTTMACVYASWFYVYHTLVTRISPRTLILHSDESKAKEDLDLIKEYLSNPLITALFEDLLSTDISSRGELNFDYAIDGSIPRKESHFVARSMYASTGGQHFSFYLLDDLCVKENTSTVDKNLQVWDVYKKLPWLDDKSGLYKILEVGTAYTDDCHHAYIVSLHKKCTPNYNVVVVPAEEIQEDGSIKYNFPDRWGEADLKQALLDVDSDMTEYQAHMNQIFYRRGHKALNLCFKREYNLFTELPNANTNPNYVTVIVGDPATSKKNKKEGDDKSRATLLTGRFYDDDTIYITGVWQSLGEELEQWIQYIADQMSIHTSELYIQDAQGTQEHHFTFQMKKIKELLNNPHIMAIPHKKSPLTGTYSKLEIAAEMLAHRFLARKIMVHESLEKVIKQLERLDAGFDIIDCLVYMVVHTKPHHIWQAMAIRNRQQRKKQTTKRTAQITGGDGFKLTNK